MTITHLDVTSGNSRMIFDADQCLLVMSGVTTPSTICFSRVRVIAVPPVFGMCTKTNFLALSRIMRHAY